MQRHHAEIEKRGARVVAITQGTGSEAAEFCAKQGTDYPCLGDPDKAAYALFGLTRGSWWNVALKGFVDDPRLAVRRIANASLAGSMMPHSDVLQLGGVAIIDRDGVVRSLHRARQPDDLPPVPEWIAELDRLAAP